MSAGTITLTNGSAVVGGSGTSFATELAAGDFIVSTVGGVDYTLPVKSVESDTALTLVSIFTGPTQSGAGWNAVPRVAMNLVTAAVVTQAAEALRGLNYDKQNWQLLFSATGDFTVRLPDGSSFTGPSWNSFVSALNGKAAKGANSDITSLTGLTTALTLEQGGTGGTTAAAARTNLELGDASTKNVGTATGTVAAGDDGRFGTVNNKTGGDISSQIVVSAPGITPALDVPASSADSGGTNAVYRVSNSGSSMIGYMATVTGRYFSFTEALNYTNGTTQYWEKRSSGQTNSPLGMLAVQGSDVRIKTDFTPPKSGAWARVEAIGICEFKYNGSDIPQRGFLAQQMGDIDSMYVFTAGKAEDESGKEFDILNVNDRAVIADMIVVIQELQQKVTALEAQAGNKVASE
ncbi:tail fiber domain-containing protein [Enterobacter roggenkampii]|uniref:tail fiber domain-containing protein n=1 Tax=Enterobacter roggenkampii TaxID=1812935 RepID=UPI001BDF82A0|nr:tail fiber domain-containing protein [Enterobacter roggenkampii]WCF42012.1 tail fiber domain-containing protein [Enterobacter roggenkampii]